MGEAMKMQEERNLKLISAFLYNLAMGDFGALQNSNGHSKAHSSLSGYEKRAQIQEQNFKVNQNPINKN